MRVCIDITPGTELEDACEFAQSLADQLGQNVEFDFNSVRCVAVPNGDAENLATRQSAAQRTTLLVKSKGGSTPELIETENV